MSAVLVASADGVLRRVVRDALEDAGLEVAGEASTLGDAIDLCRRTGPEVAVCGLGFDDGPLEAGVPAMVAAGTRVLVLGTDRRPERLTAALLAGASGCLVTDDSGPEELVAAVRTVTRGETALHPLAAAAVLEQWRRTRSAPATTRAELTVRELEVLRSMSDGLPTKAVATRLGLSVKTVEHHKGQIFRKLEARNQAHAVHLAIERGLVAIVDDHREPRPTGR